MALSSIHIYSIGFFIRPIEQEFGWSRATIGAGVTVTAVMGVLFAPLFGYFVDRFGPRRLALTGAVIYCTAIASLSLTESTVWTWFALWSGVGVGTTFLKTTVWSAAVTSMFERNRGLAIALMLSGSGVGASIMPLLANWLIADYGWRFAYMAIGALFGIIVFPVLLLFFYGAHDRGRRAKSLSSPKILAGWTMRQGFAARQFYQILIAALLITMVVVGCLVHLVEILVSTGISRQQAAGMAGLIGFMSISARLFIGHMFDRLDSPLVGATSVGIALIPALLLLALPGSVPVAILAVLILGLALGGEHDAVIYLSSRYFGQRNFGSLFGFIASSILAGVGLGPIVAGAIYDQTGSYTVFLLLAMPLAGLSSLLIGTLGPYPSHTPVTVGPWISDDE